MGLFNLPFFNSNKVSHRGRRDDMPPADGSSTMAKISADLRPQSARLWWPRQLRHGTDRRTDRARSGHNKNKINYNDSLRRELTKSVETDCACLVNIAYWNGDKMDHRRSAELIIPRSSDARPL